jgi:hypothetical protein
MNSQGYSKDNIHKGNTKIVAGGIDVDGLVRIGDQSVGGDGYVLPSVKGNEGDILTMNADNTTSFKSSSLASARVVQNLFQMEIPTYYYTNTGLPSDVYTPMYETSTGSDIIDTSQIAVGGVIRMRTKGYVYNDINNAGGNPISFGQFRLFIGINNTLGNFFCDSSESLPVIDSAGMGSNPSFGRGWWSIEVNIIKLDELNNCYVSIAGLYNGVNTSGTTSDTFDLQFYSYAGGTSTRWPNVSGSTSSPSNFYSPMPSTFKLSLSWRATQGNAFAIATEYTIDYLNIDQGVLATITAPATDHNSLANLNVGDPHQLYAYLGGRSGGQVLSGGILPIHNLTLKSHDIGLPNVIVRDLNTEFNKNIDMSSNNIINVSEVNNTSNLKLSSVGGSLDIDSNLIQFISTAVPQGQIDAVGGWEIFNALSMTNNNINNVNVLTATQVNTDTIENSGSGFLTFTNLGSYTPSFTSSGLDMNDAELLSVNNIRTNVQPILTINKNGSNATEIYGNSTIRRIQVSNAVYLLSGTNLECGTNDINDAGNVNISGSDNITLPIVIGTPSGALQVQNGGAYIKQDLQVDGSIYCDSINNIRPSGGLYSESSGFNILSTNLTETNLLGQGGSAGTLAIPANTFTQFDSYSFKASGVLSGGSNDTATLRLKSLVNGTTPVELGSIVIQLTDNGLVDVAWKVEADFNVRTLGVAGVGVLVLSGNFAYTNNNDIVKTYLRTIVNSSVFDTTQSNELQFTYQNDGTNPLTNIRIDQASFTKWY